jgi:uncharacterized damage-inducible protein DinB
MTDQAPSPTGRPEEGEYASYFSEDIAQVPGNDAIAALEVAEAETLMLLTPLDEESGDRSYAPGKWTIRQIVGHLIDDERIFVYRALCLARHDTQPLPGFDENDYVSFAGFENRTMADLLAEYRAVRRSTIAFFRGLSAEAWHRRGTVNEYTASVRGLAFHIAAHELHHLRILREQYLAD